MALCLHVATVGADEGGTNAGEHQRLPALPDGCPARGLVDVLSFLSGHIGFSVLGKANHMLQGSRADQAVGRGCRDRLRAIVTSQGSPASPIPLQAASFVAQEIGLLQLLADRVFRIDTRRAIRASKANDT